MSKGTGKAAIGNQNWLSFLVSWFHTAQARCALIALIAFILLCVVLYTGCAPQRYNLTVGSISRQTITATQSVVDEIDEFRSIVEEPEFRRLFPTLGMDRVKTVPKGFPRDFPFPEYIRPKDYSLGTAIPDDFLRQADWLQQTLHVFEVMKPFLDFINYTIDDYE